jgi:dTDP-4-dehydrorhamnose 3,5-epimerase
VIFSEASVDGALIVDVERHDDERGYFARTWCAQEFADNGLNPGLSQASVSFSRRRGTLRGLHYQAPPHAEDKLVRCPRGAIYDVVLDLRPGSPTYLRHFGLALDEETHRALYVPKGCAHGFQTLTEDTLVFYQMSEPHAPESARGVRWDDPAFGIEWPLPDPILKERDATYPDYRRQVP